MQTGSDNISILTKQFNSHVNSIIHELIPLCEPIHLAPQFKHSLSITVFIKIWPIHGRCIRTKTRMGFVVKFIIATKEVERIVSCETCRRKEADMVRHIRRQENLLTKGLHNRRADRVPCEQDQMLVFTKDFLSTRVACDHLEKKAVCGRTTILWSGKRRTTASLNL